MLSHLVELIKSKFKPRETRKFYESFLSSLIVALIFLIFMMLYQAAKFILHPDMDILEHNILTDILGVIIIFITTFVIILRLKVINEKFFETIIDRDKIEDKLQTVKRNLDLIVESKKVNIDIIDSEFNIKYVDPEWQKIYGDFKGRKCFEYFMGKNSTCPGCGIVKALETKLPFVSEELLAKEGNRPIEVTTIPFQDEKGEWMVAEINVDISERKKIKEKLLESESKYRTLIEQIPAVTYVASAEDFNKILYVSPSIKDMLGYSSEDFQKDPDLWRKRVHPDNHSHIVAKQLSSEISGRPFVAEYRMLAKNGQTIWAYDKAVLVKDAGGKPLFLQGVIFDITERKKTEEEQKRLVTVIEATPDFVGFADAKDERILYINKAGRRMCGIGDDEDVTKLKIYDVHPERMKKKFAEEILPVAIRDGVWTGEVAFLNRRDRREIPVSMVLFSHKAPNGGVEIFSTISRDITERKNSEEALRMSEEKIRAIFDQTFQFVGMMTLDGTLIEANKTAMRFAGINESDCLGKPFWDTPWWAHSKEMQNKMREAVAKAANGETVFFEATHLAADKSIHYIDFSLKPVKDKNDKVVFLIPEGHDITERKKTEEELNKYRENLEALVEKRMEELKKTNDALEKEINLRKNVEEALRVSEEHYRMLAETANDFIFVLDREGFVKYVNKICEREFKKSSEKIVGKNIAELFNTDSKSIFGLSIKKVFDSGKPYSAENNIQFPHRKIWLSTILTPLKDSGGEVSSIFGISRDITDRKNAEDEANKLASYPKLNPNPVIGINDHAEISYINPAAKKLFPDIEKIGLKHPFLEGLFEKLSSLSKEGKISYKREIRIGDVFFAQNIFLVEDTKAMRVYGADITDTKIAEELIKNSEIRYRRLFEAAKDGILILDAFTGQIVDVNPYLTDLLGYSCEELRRRKLWEIGVFKDIASSKKTFLELQNKGYVKYDDIPLETKNKKEISVEFVSNVYLVDHKKVVQCNIRNITERKMNEIALKESEKRLSAIFDKAQDGILIVDPGTKNIYFFNNMICRMLGYSGEELKNLKVMDIHPKEDLPYVLERFEGQAKGEMPLIKDIPVKRKDGSVFYADINAFLVEFSGKSYMAGFFRDVTERRQLESLKDEFVSTVSHELRTPLTVIKEGISILSDDIKESGDSKQADFINTLQNNVERLTRFISDVLDFQKIGTVGKLDIKNADINEITSSVCREMYHLAKDKGLKLAMLVDKDIPKIKIDEDKITQVLMNLVSNAIKFTEKGEISVTASKDKESAFITVEDSGIGIKKENMDKIFKAFGQIKPEKGKKIPGSGLGLAISKKIIDQHGGKIWAESEFGKGSKFVISFPIDAKRS